jgi:hypothetical protein
MAKFKMTIEAKLRKDGKAWTLRIEKQGSRLTLEDLLKGMAHTSDKLLVDDEDESEEE